MAQIHGKKLLQVNVQGQTRNLVVLRVNGSTRLFGAHLLVEGFNAEHGTGLKVISHQVADVTLTRYNSETWKTFPGFPVDASIAYEKPGVELGPEIVYSQYMGQKVVLPTGKYKGEKDIALVALGITSADFVTDGNSITLAIPDSRLIVVPNFPGLSSWYMSHAETGVPHGAPVEESPDARYIYRAYISPYVGLLSRSVLGSDKQRRDIHAIHGENVSFGVVAEVPDTDVPKIEGLLALVETSR